MLYLPYKFDYYYVNTFEDTWVGAQWATPNFHEREKHRLNGCSDHI